VWRSPDGTQWECSAANGWGERYNRLSNYYDKGMVVFENRLHVSAMNFSNGSQVWRYNFEPIQNFLPVLIP
jgi:outer membrane protein assembly factor BamB